MREIKYRGKDKDNGNWTEGLFLYNTFNGEYGIGVPGDPIFSEIKVIKVLQDTVGQYTGLHDKNGKEIYEGDIVEITRECIFERGTIINKNGCYFAKSKEILVPLYQCEINDFKLKVVRKCLR